MNNPTTSLEEIVENIALEAYSDACNGQSGDYGKPKAIADIKAWAESCVPKIHKFRGDQDDYDWGYNNAIDQMKNNLRGK